MDLAQATKQRSQGDSQGYHTDHCLGTCQQNKARADALENGLPHEWSSVCVLARLMTPRPPRLLVGEWTLDNMTVTCSVKFLLFSSHDPQRLLEGNFLITIGVAFLNYK